MQKYSSNVIEMCLDKCGTQMRSEFIKEITNLEKLSSMIKHQYGNYVVQRALKITTGIDHQILSQAIRNSMPDVKDKRIRQKWEKILFDSQIEPEFSQYLGQSSAEDDHPYNLND